MDYLVKGLARNNIVRIIGCECKDMVNTICKKHETFPVATIALGRVLCATAMLGAMVKEGQTITTTIKGDGELKAIIAQSNHKGEMRGMVTNPYVDNPLVNGKWDVSGAIGKEATLQITKSFNAKQKFTSECSLKNGDIALGFATYFFESEQMPTLINIGVELDKNGRVQSARGYIIQLLTGYTEEDLVYIKGLKEEKLDKDVSLCINNMVADFEEVSRRQINFVCDCSKGKIQKSLETLNCEELKAIIEEDKGLEAICNFCSQKYWFGEKELLEMIEKK